MKNFFIFLMVSTLMISTLGVGINTLYCHCKGEVETSLFYLEDECETKAFGCCTAEHPEQISSCKKGECGKRALKIVKLDTDFVADLDRQLNLKTPSVVQAVYNSFITLQPLAVQFLGPPTNKAPPPIWFGTNIIRFLHAFLC